MSAGLIRPRDLLGHVVLCAWLAPGARGTWVGMGSATRIAPDGRVIAHTVAPTGLKGTLG